MCARLNATRGNKPYTKIKPNAEEKSGVNKSP